MQSINGCEQRKIVNKVRLQNNANLLIPRGNKENLLLSCIYYLKEIISV